MFSELPVPIIMAHRGASAYAPENTLAAFKLALQQGADAIELDVKLTADGHVVVIHDQTVDRTTPCKGRVSDLLLADIRRMDAGSHFDIAFRGEPVPTLEQVFKAVGQLTCINIELKIFHAFHDSLPEKVAQLVKRFRLNRRVIISSFNPIPLIRIHRLLPDTPIGLLAMRGSAGFLARSWAGRLIGYQSLHVGVNDVTSRLIKNVHHRGCKILVYTVSLEKDMRDMFEMGVDGIITNDPLLAKQILSPVKLDEQ